jgi:NAD(P)-dependent dehydrogenase (short-subunit alcohol dehydrogenase family)
VAEAATDNVFLPQSVPSIHTGSAPCVPSSEARRSPEKVHEREVCDAGGSGRDHSATATAYAASKSAAVAMIDSLAADLKGTNVRANLILPGILDTEANRQAIPKADFSKWPKPHDIARVILFLYTYDAKVIRGATIPV